MDSLTIVVLSVSLVTVVLQAATLVVVIAHAFIFKSFFTALLDKIPSGKEDDRVRSSTYEPRPVGPRPAPPPVVPAPKGAPPQPKVAPPPPPKKDGGSTKPRIPATDLAWQWLSFKKYERKPGEIELKPIDGTEDGGDADGPFKVQYRIGITTPCPDTVEVVFTSPALIEYLQRCLPDNGDLKSVAQPTIPGRELYRVLRTLKSYCCDCTKSAWEDRPGNVDSAFSMSNGDHHVKQVGESGLKELQADDGGTLGILYVRHLVRFLEGEYKDVLKRVSRMREEKRATWDMLWAFFTKDTKVVYHCDLTGELLCAVVTWTQYRKKKSPYGDEEILTVHLNAYNFNGTRFKSCSTSRDFETYRDERNLSELQVCPIEFWGDPVELEKKFLAKGNRFHELAVKKPNRFMLYDGSMYWKARVPLLGWQTLAAKADGRVMIDLCSFAAMNPDYPMGSARPPTKSHRELGVAADTTTGQEEEVTDNNLIFAPATVFGFSFALKTWGCFSVSQFSDITFDRGAFQDLVMEPSLKTIVHDLVRQYISSTYVDSGDASEQVDFTREKGQGCIVLCHGPPGTGKTLTAESIAESMDCPLWALSVSELGTNPRDLESTLVKVLHIASVWKAVLLLDEADIYLEGRTSMRDIVRNSMTGVFLRQLEYFRGILFLTTNRIDTIDDAFKSRISAFLHYEELDAEDKAKVWGNLLRKANVGGASQKFCEKMADQLANGREIRNAIRTAQIWARSQGESFEVKHIEHVLGPLMGTQIAERDCSKHNFYYL